MKKRTNTWHLSFHKNPPIVCCFPAGLCGHRWLFVVVLGGVVIAERATDRLLRRHKPFSSDWSSTRFRKGSLAFSFLGGCVGWGILNGGWRCLFLVHVIHLSKETPKRRFSDFFPKASPMLGFSFSCWNRVGAIRKRRICGRYCYVTMLCVELLGRSCGGEGDCGENVWTLLLPWYVELLGFGYCSHAICSCWG